MKNSNSSAIRWLLPSLSVLSLFSCGGGTNNIQGHGISAAISVGGEKKLSDVTAVEFDYIGLAGENSQEISGSGVQYNGNRLNAPATLENKFTLHIGTAHYRFDAINTKHFNLSLAPGAAFALTNFDTRAVNTADTFSPSISETNTGLGIRMGADLTFQRFSVLTEVGYYLSPADGFDSIGESDYLAAGFWYAFRPQDNMQFKFGASGHSLGTLSDLKINDNCDIDATAENCSDSNISVSTMALQLGVEFKL